MTPALHECPFCGWEASVRKSVLVAFEGERAEVGCDRCGYFLCGKAGTIIALIERWNKRALTSAEKRIEDLEKERDQWQITAHEVNVRNESRKAELAAKVEELSQENVRLREAVGDAVRLLMTEDGFDRAMVILGNVCGIRRAVDLVADKIEPVDIRDVARGPNQTFAVNLPAKAEEQTP